MCTTTSMFKTYCPFRVIPAIFVFCIIVSSLVIDGVHAAANSSSLFAATPVTNSGFGVLILCAPVRSAPSSCPPLGVEYIINRRSAGGRAVTNVTAIVGLSNFSLNWLYQLPMMETGELKHIIIDNGVVDMYNWATLAPQQLPSITFTILAVEFFYIAQTLPNVAVMDVNATLALAAGSYAGLLSKTKSVMIVASSRVISPFGAAALQGVQFSCLQCDISSTTIPRSGDVSAIFSYYNTLNSSNVNGSYLTQDVWIVANKRAVQAVSAVQTAVGNSFRMKVIGVVVGDSPAGNFLASALKTYEAECGCIVGYINGTLQDVYTPLFAALDGQFQNGTIPATFSWVPTQSRDVVTDTTVTIPRVIREIDGYRESVATAEHIVRGIVPLGADIRLPLGTTPITPLAFRLLHNSPVWADPLEAQEHLATTVSQGRIIVLAACWQQMYWIDLRTDSTGAATLSGGLDATKNPICNSGFSVTAVTYMATIVFGGRYCTGHGSKLNCSSNAAPTNDMWLISFSCGVPAGETDVVEGIDCDIAPTLSRISYTQTSAVPSARFGHATVGSTQSHAMYLCGGRTSMSSSFLLDCWKYLFLQNAWFPIDSPLTSAREDSGSYIVSMSLVPMLQPALTVTMPSFLLVLTERLEEGNFTRGRHWHGQNRTIGYNSTNSLLTSIFELSTYNESWSPDVNIIEESSPLECVFFAKERIWQLSSTTRTMIPFSREQNRWLTEYTINPDPLVAAYLGPQASSSYSNHSGGGSNTNGRNSSSRSSFYTPFICATHVLDGVPFAQSSVGAVSSISALQIPRLTVVSLSPMKDISTALVVQFPVINCSSPLVESMLSASCVACPSTTPTTIDNACPVASYVAVSSPDINVVPIVIAICGTAVLVTVAILVIGLWSRKQRQARQAWLACHDPQNRPNNGDSVVVVAVSIVGAAAGWVVNFHRMAELVDAFSAVVFKCCAKRRGYIDRFRGDSGTIMFANPHLAMSFVQLLLSQCKQVYTDRHNLRPVSLVIVINEGPVANVHTRGGAKVGTGSKNVPGGGPSDCRFGGEVFSTSLDAIQTIVSTRTKGGIYVAESMMTPETKTFLKRHRWSISRAANSYGSLGLSLYRVSKAKKKKKQQHPKPTSPRQAARRAAAANSNANNFADIGDDSGGAPAAHHRTSPASSSSTDDDENSSSENSSELNTDDDDILLAAGGKSKQRAMGGERMADMLADLPNASASPQQHYNGKAPPAAGGERQAPMTIEQWRQSVAAGKKKNGASAAAAQRHFNGSAGGLLEFNGSGAGGEVDDSQQQAISAEELAELDRQGSMLGAVAGAGCRNLTPQQIDATTEYAYQVISAVFAVLTPEEKQRYFTTICTKLNLPRLAVGGFGGGGDQSHQFIAMRLIADRLLQVSDDGLSSAVLSLAGGGGGRGDIGNGRQVRATKISTGGLMPRDDNDDDENQRSRDMPTTPVFKTFE